MFETNIRSLQRPKTNLNANLKSLMNVTNPNNAFSDSGIPVVPPAGTEPQKPKTTAAAIANSAHLPTLPDVASQFIALAQQEEPDFQEMARTIRLDPAISGRILTTANSALMGFRRKIESVEEAIPKLGTSIIRTLILGFHLGSFESNDRITKRLLPRLWQNFLTQAVFAESIAEQTHLEESMCFLAGMVQDIGILALVSEYPEEYAENVLAHSKLPNVLAAENAYFGFNHLDVSIEIIKKWNLGDQFLDAIQHHHDRFVSVTEDGCTDDPLHAVLQASHMGAGLLIGLDDGEEPDGCQLSDWHSFLENHFGYASEQASEMLADVGSRVEEYSVVFGVDAGQRINSARVANSATKLLQSIALEALSTQNKNEDEVYFDYLSGLYNRRYLSEVLSKRISEWVRRRKTLAMLFIDVDGFKEVNDVHGHATGDDLICHIASWLTSATRSSDHILRLGGDEFLIAAQIKRSHLDKLCKRLSGDVPAMQTDDGKSIKVAMSIGCIFYEPSKNDNVDPNWIIDKADQLMYNTKREGGGSVKILNIKGNT